MNSKRKEKLRSRKVTLAAIERETVAKRRASQWENPGESSNETTHVRKMSDSDTNRRTTSSINRRKRATTESTVVSRRKSTYEMGREIAQERRKSVHDMMGGGWDGRKKSTHEMVGYQNNRRKSIFDSSSANETPVTPRRGSIARRNSILQALNVNSDYPSLIRRTSVFTALPEEGETSSFSRRKSVYPTINVDETEDETLNDDVNMIDVENPGLTSRRRVASNPEKGSPSISIRRDRYSDSDATSTLTSMQAIMQRSTDDSNYIPRNEFKDDWDISAIAQCRRLPPYISEPSDNENDSDSDNEEREFYRQTFLEPAPKDDVKPTKLSEYIDRFTKFIEYLSVEHEMMLQVVMVLPLLLMTLYITVIEQGEVVRFADK